MGGVTSTMAAKFAFFPPSPATYTLVKDDKTELLILSPFPHRENVEILKLSTRRGTEIIAMYVRNPMAVSTVLYSHGNAADLGQMYELFIELAILLRVNVFGYDYSGYGQSSGKPSEQNTYADIEAAYKCLEESFSTKQEEIILYGQSVGSGPTLDLAARLPLLRAVVLHSPILSGLRVMYPVKRTYWFDIYKNIEKIPLVNSPVLIMHVRNRIAIDANPIYILKVSFLQGTADDVVDCSHGRQLWELCQEKYEPLWLQGASHCDLEHFPEYMKHLRKFIFMVEKTPSQRYDLRRNTEMEVEAARKSTDRRQSVEKVKAEKVKCEGNYTGRVESLKMMALDQMDCSRRSLDCFEKPRKNGGQQPERARKSFDRIRA